MQGIGLSPPHRTAAADLREALDANRTLPETYAAQAFTCWTNSVCTKLHGNDIASKCRDSG